MGFRQDHQIRHPLPRNSLNRASAESRDRQYGTAARGHISRAAIRRRKSRNPSHGRQAYNCAWRRPQSSCPADLSISSTSLASSCRATSHTRASQAGEFEGVSGKLGGASVPAGVSTADAAAINMENNIMVEFRQPTADNALLDAAKGLHQA